MAFVKSLFVCWFLLLGTIALGQSADTILGIVRDKRGDALEFAELVFRDAAGGYRSISESQGKFVLTGIPDGAYLVMVSQDGKLLETQAAVAVRHDNRPLIITCQVYYCPYQPAGKRRPACVNGHRNKLIPVVYGLPGPKMIKAAKAGKMHLGGCAPAVCSPSYYCPVHDKEL